MMLSLLLHVLFFGLPALVAPRDTLPGAPAADSLRHADSLETPAPVDSVVLVFGGDCLLTDHYTSAVGDDVGYGFRELDLLPKADVAMVNLECPVTTRGTRASKPFTFRMDPRHLSAITGAGIDIVNIANNHIYDFDRIGLFDTISYLDSAGIMHVGAGRTAAEAHRPVIVETKSRRVAFLGYYGGGEAPASGRTTPGVARRNITLIRRDIVSAKQTGNADFVVVNLHWGNEKAPVPEQWQQDLGRAIIDAGANAVVGHHPHVLQGVELYKGGVIAYSLGNFIFGGNSRSTYDTALLEIILKDAVPAYRMVPVRVTNWQASELRGAAADSVLDNVRRLSAGFEESIFHMQETK